MLRSEPDVVFEEHGHQVLLYAVEVGDGWAIRIAIFHAGVLQHGIDRLPLSYGDRESACCAGAAFAMRLLARGEDQNHVLH